MHESIGSPGVGTAGPHFCLFLVSLQQSLNILFRCLMNKDSSLCFNKSSKTTAGYSSKCTLGTGKTHTSAAEVMFAGIAVIIETSVAHSNRRGEMHGEEAR